MNELIKIQNELKAPKKQRNNFGDYNYRSCEDILEALKPLLNQFNCYLILSDSIELIGDRYYVKSTATLFNNENNSISVTAFAREVENKKGMDGAQISGGASSYARKYALNGLFAIDDTKDSDYTNTHGKDVKMNTKEPLTASQLKQLRDEMIKMQIGKDYGSKFFKMIGFEPAEIPKIYFNSILELVKNDKLIDAVDNGDITWLK